MPYKNKKKQADYQHRWYKNNLYIYRTRNRKSAEDKKNQLYRLKAFYGCAFCSENDPCCLEFHHADPSTKLFHVGSGTEYGWPKLNAEIAKCIILCANCHRKLEHNK